MAENRKLVIEASDWVHNIILIGHDNDKRHAEWYCPADFLEIDRYTKSAYLEGLAHGKKIGEQEGLDKAWAAARRVLKEWQPSGAIGGTYKQSECLDGITAQQAIDTFEQADSAIVKGDEAKVCLTGSLFLVTNADPSYGYSGINTEGRVFLQQKEDIVKTGRHFDSIDAYLKGE